MNNKKEYLGTKYNENIFPKGKTTNSNISIERDNLKEKLKTINNTKQFWNLFSNEINYNYSRPISIKEKDMITEEKYKLNKFKEYFSKENRIRKKRNETNLSPDEIILKSKINKKIFKSIILFECGFISLLGMICFLKRSFISKSYIFISLLLGTIFSVNAGCLINAKYTIVELDKLGNEFELSRQAKQFIFSKRRDLSTEQKSEIYNLNNEE